MLLESCNIYIIGKQYNKKIQQLIRTIICDNATIINDKQFNNDVPFGGLAENLSCLKTTDLCILTPGWNNFSDCRIEFKVARAYQLPILKCY